MAKDLKQQRTIGETFQDVAIKRTSSLVDNIRAGGLEFLANGPGDTTLGFNLPDPNFAFKKSNNSFSGTDCTVVVTYNQNMLVIGNLETFSYSIFREKNPVRTLGNIYPKGYTYGTRTIGGSMVFVQFDEHPLYPLFQFFNERTDKTHRFSSPLSDDIPPFDIMLIFNNEYGAKSVIRLYGVELFQEGGVFSINDIYSENTIQFVARDMDPMISAGEENSWKELLYQKQVEGKIVDHHFGSMIKYRQRLEGQIADLGAEIDQLSKGASGSVNLDVRSDRLRERRQTRQNTRQLINKKTSLRASLVAELERLDNSINQYERTKMTWDMNSSLSTYHMDSSTNSIATKTTDVVNPTGRGVQSATSDSRPLYGRRGGRSTSGSNNDGNANTKG